MGPVVSERPGSTYSPAGATIDQVYWYFFRVSGLMLVVLAGGHLFITHYLNVPSETTFDFVSNRWANPLWRTFDWLLLLMALWHGLLGSRNVAIDYISSRGARLALVTAIFMIGFIFTAIGTVTILTFNEAAALNNTGPLAGDLWIADLMEVLLYAFAVLTYAGAAIIGIYVIKHLSLGTRPVYRGDLGQYAWLLHRVTGLGILFFLIVHIIDIMLIGLGRDVYDQSVEAYGQTILLPMEVALVGAVIYHSLNGLRIILIDFWEDGVKHQRSLYIAALIGTILLTIPSAVIIFQNEL